MAAKDLSGSVFHSLTVMERHPENSTSNKVLWKCRCECGNESLVTTQALKNGNTKSCGCRRVEASRKNGRARQTHGLTGSPEYKAWQSMKDRCYNPDNCSYPNYGARGICVWKEWMRSFEVFFSDLGPRPSSEHSLDRIDVNGHYEPSNCRWATAEEQANNKRDNRRFLVDGQDLTIAQISKLKGIPVATLASRLDRDNLNIEEAIGLVASKHEFTYNGKTQRLNEWVKELDLTYSTVYQRIFIRGWSFEKAISDKDHRRKV